MNSALYRLIGVPVVNWLDSLTPSGWAKLGISMTVFSAIVGPMVEEWPRSMQGVVSWPIFAGLGALRAWYLDRGTEISQ